MQQWRTEYRIPDKVRFIQLTDAGLIPKKRWVNVDHIIMFRDCTKCRRGAELRILDAGWLDVAETVDKIVEMIGGDDGSNQEQGE